MRENRILAKIRQDKLAIATYAGFADPALVEIIGLAGFDGAFIDCEHTAFDYKLVEEMARAADLMGITAIVRPPDNNPKTILRYLDMGVQAIYVPHIKNREDAMATVKAVRYAPLGERGVPGPVRASRYGTVPMAEHQATSNSEIMVAVTIEDEEALNDLEGIASVDGVDVVSVGPSDLMQALGISDSSDPRLASAVEKISTTLRKVGKAKMSFSLNHPTFPLNAVELYEMGVRYANCQPSDFPRLISSYQQQIQEIQAQFDCAGIRY